MKSIGITLVLCLVCASVVAAAEESPQGQATEKKAKKLNPRLLAMADNTWMKMSPARNPKSRTYSGACFGAGRLYYFGGGHFSYTYNDVELYDPVTNIWTQVTKPERPAGTYKDWVRTASEQASPSGAPYLGGHTYQYTSWDPIRKRFFLPYRQCGVWEFDPAAAKWENILSVFRNAKPKTPHNLGPGTMANIHSAFDLNLVKPVLVVTSGAAGLYVFDYKNRAWQKHKPLPGLLTGTELYSTYVDEWKGHLFASNRWRQPNTDFLKVDLAAGTAEAIERPARVGKCHALAYDSANKMVIVMPIVELPEKGSTVSIWALDVKTMKWTEMKPTGPVPKGAHIGKWAPLWYDPEHNVHLFLKFVSRGPAYQGGDIETWAYRYKSTEKKGG